MEKAFVEWIFKSKPKEGERGIEPGVLSAKFLDIKKVFFGPKDSYLECSLLEVASKQKKPWYLSPPGVNQS